MCGFQFDLDRWRIQRGEQGLVLPVAGERVDRNGDESVWVAGNVDVDVDAGFFILPFLICNKAACKTVTRICRNFRVTTGLQIGTASSSARAACRVKYCYKLRPCSTSHSNRLSLR
jgi:hypothetical protein